MRAPVHRTDVLGRGVNRFLLPLEHGCELFSVSSMNVFDLTKIINWSLTVWQIPVFLVCKNWTHTQLSKMWKHFEIIPWSACCPYFKFSGVRVFITEQLAEVDLGSGKGSRDWEGDCTTTGGGRALGAWRPAATGLGLRRAVPRLCREKPSSSWLDPAETVFCGISPRPSSMAPGFVIRLVWWIPCFRVRYLEIGWVLLTHCRVPTLVSPNSMFSTTNLGCVAVWWHHYYWKW